MNVAFTICSNNYLAQASVLAESFKKHNAEDYFAIVLVDEPSELVNYKRIAADEIVFISALGDYRLNSLYDKYDIIELSTAVKPFAFKYFINKFIDISIFYYFDPDIKIFSNTRAIDEQLASASVVLTPHIYTPIPLDGLAPQETLFLNYGIYNLGFIGLNAQHSNCEDLLNWWGERTYEIGYSDVANGLFVDQLWMNFAPLFFLDVKVLTDRGCNMGPWNLHERSIKYFSDDVTFLSNGDSLKFYHFSSYDYRRPELLSKHYNRYSFDNTGSLKNLYKQYHDELVDFNVREYSTISYAHGKKRMQIAGKSLNFLQRLKAGIKIILDIDK